MEHFQKLRFENCKDDMQYLQILQPKETNNVVNRGNKYTDPDEKT